MLKKLLTSLNFTFTLGQSVKLEVAKVTYQQKYEHYLALYKGVDGYKKEFDETVIVIEKALTEAKDYLEKSEKVIETSVRDKSGLDINIATHTLDKIDRLKDGFNSSLGVGAGSIAGGSLALGSWGLVAALGSASTGAVISGLSGVAATNATLAWFGGGALAAGGAGMLGGVFVLFFLSMIPVFFIATKFTRQKTKKYEKALAELEDAIDRTRMQLNAFPAILATLQIKKLNVLNLCEKFILDADLYLNVIRPPGIFNVARQRICSFFGKTRYTSQQTDALENLAQSVTVFLGEIRMHLKA